MKKKNTTSLMIRIILDIVMLVLLTLSYSKMAISMSFHELAGLGVFLLFIIHHLLNISWLKATAGKLFTKLGTAKLRASWIINILLAVTTAGIIVTGLMITKTLPFRIGQFGGAKQWHYCFAALTIILMGVHLGLHCRMLIALVNKHKLFSTPVVKALLYVFFAASLLWGGYSLVTGSFTRWLTGPFVESSFGPEGHGDFSESKMPDDQGTEKPSYENQKKDMKERPKDQQGIDEFQNSRPDSGEKHEGSKEMHGNQPGETGILNAFRVIATYTSEMIVFAAVTALITWIVKPKKKEQGTGR